MSPDAAPSRSAISSASISPAHPSPADRRAQLLLFLAIAAVMLWRLLALAWLDLTLYVDEAQYWTWAQQLEWGYFSKPPGVALLIAASTALFGDGPVGVKALAMACYPLSAGLAYLIARRFAPAQTALWAALLVLTLPIYGWLGLFVSTDALLTVFWLLAVLFYLRALDGNAWRDWLLLGLIAGLGLLSKYTMVVCLLAVSVHLLCFHRARLGDPRPWVAALLAVLLLLPNMAWNVANDFPTLRHTADITVNKRAGGGFGQLGEFWVAQWLAFGPLLGGAFLLFLARWRQWRGDAPLPLLLWLAVPLWAVVSLQALKSNANANWAAPAFAPAAIALAIWLRQSGRQRLLLAGLAVNLLFVAITYAWTPLIAWAGVREAAKRDPFTRARGWDALGAQLAPLVSAHPKAILLAENRTLLAHLRYELRRAPPLIASWNPEGRAADYYKMRFDLAPHIGRDVLFVSQDALPPSLAQRFADQQALARLSVALDERQARSITVYLLHDFKGY